MKGIASAKTIGGRQWPVSSLAVEHILQAACCSNLEARTALQEALRNGFVEARGPLQESSRDAILADFWHYTFPDEDGQAFNLELLVNVPWFEVRAEQVLKLWPARNVLASSAGGSPMGRGKPSQAQVTIWIQEYYRSASEEGKAPPKRDQEAFPDCRRAIGASDAQMRKAMREIPGDLKRHRGLRDR